MDERGVAQVGGPQEPDHDRVGRALAEMLAAARRVPPDRLPELSEAVARASGVSAVRIWLADYSFRWLGCFPPEQGRGLLTIDGTLAGRAFEVGETVDVAGPDGVTLWVPLVDGVDRIGVVEFELDRVDAERRGTLSQIAALLAAEIVTRGQYTDSMAVARRTGAMTLAAEMQWALLRPPTFSTDDVSVAASVEPSDHIAGDAYDYAYTSGMLDFALFDAMGHDLRASLMAALAVGTYRWGRRHGLGIEEQAALMDRTIAEQFHPTMFVTALLCRLDVRSGTFTWAGAGHPAPALVREGRVVGTLDTRPGPPLGLGSIVPTAVTANTVSLQPGDRVLLYTDGVVEARRVGGGDFGLDRLSDFLERALSTGLPDAEIVRRLSNAIVDHHDGDLGDDATMVLVHWHPAPVRVRGSSG